MGHQSFCSLIFFDLVQTLHHIQYFVRKYKYQTKLILYYYFEQKVVKGDLN